MGSGGSQGGSMGSHMAQWPVKGLWGSQGARCAFRRPREALKGIKRLTGDQELFGARVVLRSGLWGSQGARWALRGLSGARKPYGLFGGQEALI